MLIRLARPDDARAFAAIYGPIVTGTTISFEEVPPTETEFRARIAAIGATWPWLVGEVDGEVLGYVYASRHRERAAYRWSVDVTAYVHEDARGRGVAGTLYRALFRILERQGFHRAFAGITMPNDASVALHRSVGFALVGVYPEVGFKFGTWRDTSWWQRPLREGIPSGDPIPVTQLDAHVLREAGVAEDA
ncbi:MAG TPA: arsinothricin resistance N-acetyltransferase ArsN1 family B [Candidatus Limnocylindria bacterium]|nr:arsinothricin resistance N-acetyltransferase ArsN1 family B [Candidatus Limnocylindria bacterium]